MLFTDANSLVYEIKTDNMYEDFFEDKNLFDFSNYPQGSKLFYLVNKKVNDKVKDDFKGEINSEFVGLKSDVLFS